MVDDRPALPDRFRDPAGEPPDGCTCQGCGRHYRVDVMVPDDLWRDIRPPGEPDGSGLLCGRCIVEALEGRGFGAFALEDLPGHTPDREAPAEQLWHDEALALRGDLEVAKARANKAEADRDRLAARVEALATMCEARAITAASQRVRCTLRDHAADLRALLSPNPTTETTDA